MMRNRSRKLDILYSRQKTTRSLSSGQLTGSRESSEEEGLVGEHDAEEVMWKGAGFSNRYLIT